MTDKQGVTPLNGTHPSDRQAAEQKAERCVFIICILKVAPCCEFSVSRRQAQGSGRHDRCTALLLLEMELIFIFSCPCSPFVFHLRALQPIIAFCPLLTSQSQPGLVSSSSLLLSRLLRTHKVYQSVSCEVQCSQC